MYKSAEGPIKGMQGSSFRKPCRYADLKNDYMFKRIFGTEECKDILIMFLNQIISDTEILDVRFINTEVLGMTEEDSKIVVDIACITSDGSEFIVEMQNARQEHFRERALFYTSYPLQHQKAVARQKHESHPDGAKFTWDFNLTPIRLIAILNFAFEHHENWPQEKYSSSYHIMEDESGERLTDKLQYIFLELGRFRKSANELVTPWDKWMYLFKNLGEMTSRPEMFAGSEYNHLFESANFCTFTPEEYQEYQQHENMEYDYQNCLDYRYKEGINVGIERGMLKGIEKKAEETARKCIELGMDIKTIMLITGLSETEISKVCGR